MAETVPSPDAMPDPLQLAEAGAARRLALQGDSNVEPDATFLRFELGGERYAIPLEWVTKIERVPQIVPVPRTPGWVRGIASLRGEIVCVVDLRAVIGLSSSLEQPRGLLVLADGPRRVAILSDVLPDYFKAKPSHLVPAPHGRGGEQFVTQGFERDEGFVAVLEAKNLMDALERRIDA